jgi:acrylyl-CoA reductase (NADPH)
LSPYKSISGPDCRAESIKIALHAHEGRKMSEKFRALMVSKTDDAPKADFVEITEDDLMEGDVTVAVDYSTVNYKDGLALTGAAPIIRKYPLIPGIDFAGTVTASRHAGFSEGDRVVLNGYGVGEGHHGGYAQKARVPGDWLVKLSDNITTSQAMAIGTAGYTAMLSVMGIEDGGVTPDKGPVLVTGAAGGVGSVAISILSKLGYKVIASTGRASEADYLKERWAGAVDAVGSHTLCNAISQTAYGGTVTACGLAQGMDLPGSVAPFILRGVRLQGIDSVMAPMVKREMAWRRLATDLDMRKLEAMTSEAKLEDLPGLAGDILAGKVRGRVVVDVNA